MKKILLLILKITLALLISFLLLMAAGFFAVRWGWTDVAGEEDSNSEAYNQLAEYSPDNDLYTLENSQASTTQKIGSLPQTASIYGPNTNANWCQITEIYRINSYHGQLIKDSYQKTRSEILLNNMILAFRLRLGSQSFSERLEDCKSSQNEYGPEDAKVGLGSATSTNLFVWQEGEAWQIIESALAKDKDAILRAAEAVNIQPRLLVSVAIVEQLRLFYTQRELFEKVFKPLGILANANKMAWGIMAIKEKTAIMTEDHLKDENSPFYLGKEAATLLDYGPEDDKAKVRYARLTDEKDHYYSYLYGALIIKQIENQWEKAGYSISYRPEISATVFNIGFGNSEPKKDPKVGGSTIEIDGQKYFFGSLAHEFYYSGVMADVFPYE
jgi:hypothetical protein